MTNLKHHILWSFYMCTNQEWQIFELYHSINIIVALIKSTVKGLSGRLSCHRSTYLGLVGFHALNKKTSYQLHIKQLVFPNYRFKIEKFRKLTEPYSKQFTISNKHSRNNRRISMNNLTKRILIKLGQFSLHYIIHDLLADIQTNLRECERGCDRTLMEAVVPNVKTTWENASSLIISGSCHLTHAWVFI